MAGAARDLGKNNNNNSNTNAINTRNTNNHSNNNNNQSQGLYQSMSRNFVSDGFIPLVSSTSKGPKQPNKRVVCLNIISYHTAPKKKVNTHVDYFCGEEGQGRRKSLASLQYQGPTFAHSQ